MSDTTLVTSSVGEVTLAEGMSNASLDAPPVANSNVDQPNLFDAPAPVTQAPPAPEPAPIAPAPVQAAEPERKEDNNITKVNKKADAVDLLLSKLEEQNAKYGQLIKNQLNQQRVEYLRSIGASLANDAHLLMLSPDADVSTADGRAAIDNWKNGDGRDYFTQPVSAKNVDVEELSKSVRGSANGTFKPELLKSLLAHNLRTRND